LWKRWRDIILAITMYLTMFTWWKTCETPSWTRLHEMLRPLVCK
jgi:hypothetical protein